MIDIPKLPEPEFECIRDFNDIKVLDRIIIDNYLYYKGNCGKNFIIKSVNGKGVNTIWISIQNLSDNFQLVK